MSTSPPTGPAAGGRRRKAVLRAGCLGLILFPLAGEIGARLWDRAAGGAGSLYDSIVPAGSRFKLRPGTAVTVPERYGDITYSFNRDGYRDADPDPRPGRRRIVLLGDSVSFGLGVDQEEIFAHRLEERLGAEIDPAYELLNLAVFAYHTGNELDAFREDGLRYRPEIAVLQLYMNDLAMGPPAAPVAAPAASVRDRLTALKNRFAFKSALYRRLHQIGTGLTFRLLHDLRRTRFPESLNDDEPRGKKAYLEATPDDEAVPAFRALREIQSVARRHGVRLLVVVTPDEVQLFGPGYDLINDRVRGFCRREGIDLFDPLPALRAAPNRVELYNDGVHFSAEGHRRMGDLLFAELVRRRLVGGDP